MANMSILGHGTEFSLVCGTEFSLVCGYAEPSLA
jgi:hypothetical protein